jgi:ATP-dependent DNA helicase DinG
VPGRAGEPVTDDAREPARGVRKRGPGPAQAPARGKVPRRSPQRQDSGERAVPGIDALLGAAVAGVGGTTRDGQVAMARAIMRAIEGSEHLAVQAGTGTGKSLAYLVPAAAHARATGSRVVVATATIALQRQLIDRDLPRLAAALEPLLGRAPTFAILKGRHNYLCLYRLKEGAPEDPGDTLFDPAATSVIGEQVQRLHGWAAGTATGDRDELVPGVAERAWRQVAVSSRECLGASRCPFGTECFAERAREEAGQADIVVTNHALLAIDALEEFGVLPEHQVVVVDEAHDLVNRVTSAAAAELPAASAESAARRCARLDPGEAPARLTEAAGAFGRVLAEVPEGRMDFLPQPLAASLASLRDAASACITGIRLRGQEDAEDTERMALARAALAALDEVRGTADRVLGAFGDDVAARPDVVWLERPAGGRRPPVLRVAPLDVGPLLAERLFGRQVVVLTSATLTLGGSFDPLARQWGLPPSGATAAGVKERGDGEGPVPEDEERERLRWSGLDVGSPFDHPRSGILYVARHLPPPGRDGLPESYLTELAELIDAAGGRTLGLFSSMRAARQAAGELRGVISQPLLCQGDDATARLVREFAADEPTCLFGTLSLWQGVDVPGPSLQLVVIDRIPFPRPGDPLASARQRAVAARGGNAFMTVAAAHAALLLAQGAGRLLRSTGDKGMVAILDPRLVTARYGHFLRASLPPFWTTTDPAVARAALRRLAGGSRQPP